MLALFKMLLVFKQGGARGPGADNGLIFLNMCTVVVVVDLSVRSAGVITVRCRTFT